MSFGCSYVQAHVKKKKAPAWPEQKNLLLVNMCVHEADSIKMSAIGEWQCADDWWLTNAKSRLRFCSMMSNIDSVSVGSYANARALQRDLRLKLQAKNPLIIKKKCFPSPGKKSFWKILKGAAAGRGCILNRSPQAEGLVGPFFSFGESWEPNPSLLLHPSVWGCVSPLQQLVQSKAATH